MFFFPLLSILIWAPIFLGLIVFIIKKKLIKYLIYFNILINFIINFFIYYNFNNNINKFQFIENLKWINELKINYHLGIDGISFLFIPLIFICSTISLLISLKSKKKNKKIYLGIILIISGLMFGVFTSLNSILFYIFLESILIPTFFIIGIWGNNNNIHSAFKLFLYTIFGSFLMLIGIIYLYLKSNNFEIQSFYNLKLSQNEQIYIFLCFFIAFAIKLPIWPFHTWLPNVHVKAPTEGSILLSSIMLKFGAYGFLRFILPITPYANFFFSKIIIILSLFSIIIIGFITLIQKNIKKLIAYSSINHMGLITLGFFLFNILGITGSIIQMISHALISTGMFMLIGILYNNSYKKNFIYYRGLANNMPKFSVFFVLFLLANCALPFTSGFIGEFLIILGSLKNNFFIGLLSSLIIILSAIYSLWLIKKIIFGKKKNKNKNFKDIDNLDFLILSFLIILILIIGIYPQVILNSINSSSNNLLNFMIIK